MQAATQKTVLILGARGRFGNAAAQAFAAGGWRVVAQMRPGAQALPGAGITWLPVAVDDTAALVQAARGASVVVHALNPVYTDWKAQAMPLLEDGLRLAQSLGALFMLPGNVYNFGAGMPARLNEHTPQNAHTRKGRIRVAMEQRLQQAAAAGEVRSTVIRAGDFFGSGTGNWFDRVLVKDIERGRIGYPGPADVPTPWAYLPDLAQAFVRVAEKLEHTPMGFTPLHFEGHHLSGRDWKHLLADAARHAGWTVAEQELRMGSLPWPLLRAGGVLVPMWRELAEMRYLWNTPHALVGDRLTSLIGLEPRTPLLLALREALIGLGKVPTVPCATPAWA